MIFFKKKNLLGDPLHSLSDYSSEFSLRGPVNNSLRRSLGNWLNYLESLSTTFSALAQIKSFTSSLRRSLDLSIREHGFIREIQNELNLFKWEHDESIR